MFFVKKSLKNCALSGIRAHTLKNALEYCKNNHNLVLFPLTPIWDTPVFDGMMAKWSINSFLIGL